MADIVDLSGSNCGSGFGFLGSNLEVGFDVAVWFFAFGFILSCEGCGGCVVVVVG